MTHSCAPYPQNALGLVQSALVEDTSRKLNCNHDWSSRSANCKRALHVPRLHRCFWSNRENLHYFRLEQKTNAVLHLTRYGFQNTSVQNKDRKK